MVLLLDHLEQEELQVIGLGHAPQDGVIRGLLAHLDLPQLPVGILCGGVKGRSSSAAADRGKAAGTGSSHSVGRAGDELPQVFTVSGHLMLLQ